MLVIIIIMTSDNDLDDPTMTIFMITIVKMTIIMMALKFCFYVLILKLKISSSGCFHLHGTNCLNAHLSLWHMHYGVSIIVIIIIIFIRFYCHGRNVWLELPLYRLSLRRTLWSKLMLLQLLLQCSNLHKNCHHLTSPDMPRKPSQSHIVMFHHDMLFENVNTAIERFFCEHQTHSSGTKMHYFYSQKMQFYSDCHRYCDHVLSSRWT